ncbi:MAG: argininosuccinate lyase [Verrucomicrobiota bacterium]
MASTSKQATWGGRFSGGPAELMVHFGESVSFDQQLARFDIEGSRAHAAMLAKVGLLRAEEAAAIDTGLADILAEVEAGRFTWEVRYEDVHMNIEQQLTARVPAAAKLHTARSRNDQVATDMRLWFRWAAGELAASVAALMRVLLAQAEQTQAVYIPGYTHLQRAQPVSMAHHLLAYVEMLGRDRTRLLRLLEDAKWCPLGSGAMAGSTLPIDRAETARRLGFTAPDGTPQPTRNSMDAIADRDLFHDFAHAGAVLGVHLSRMAEDLILWTSAEFGYVKFSDAFTTGSSLMPQKKNPDALELIRGKTGRLCGHVTALLTMVKGLPLTYNRDLQEDKPPVFDAFATASACLAVMAGTIEGMTVREEACARAVADPALLATDVVDYLVRRGVPFREAHHLIGALVAESEKTDTPLPALPFATVGALHPAFGEDWVECFSLERAMAGRENTGMPGPRQVTAELAAWRERLDA